MENCVQHPLMGRMMDEPLMISSIIRFAARHHGATEVVSQAPDFSLHRSNYAEIERRSRTRILLRTNQRLTEERDCLCIGAEFY